VQTYPRFLCKQRHLVILAMLENIKKLRWFVRSHIPTDWHKLQCSRFRLQEMGNTYFWLWACWYWLNKDNFIITPRIFRNVVKLERQFNSWKVSFFWKINNTAKLNSNSEQHTHTYILQSFTTFYLLLILMLILTNTNLCSTLSKKRNVDKIMVGNQRDLCLYRNIILK
jgi:hypothetical protein